MSPKRIHYAETQTDRLSELPPQILSKIISNVRVRDAVSASVLSSTWKHLCASSVSHLDFSMCTMFVTPENYVEPTMNADNCPQYKDLFIRGVNQFLQFYKGPQLVSFKVCFCLGRGSASDIDQWVHFALSKAVEELCLDFSCLRFPEEDKRYRKRSNDLYIFRPVLLYGGDVAKLKLLSLRSCLLRPDFDSILYRCLNLGSVILQDCRLPVKLRISGAHHCLKSFGIFNCSGMKQIVVSSTSLNSFEYYGFYVQFSFSAPNLEKISIGALDRPGAHYIFGKLARDLPQIKTLSIIGYFRWLKFLPKQVNWFYPFRKVEQLRLYYFPLNEFDIQKMIAILRACPRLQKFHLVTHSPENNKQRGITVPTECVHKYLKEVEIGGFFGTWNQIEFALYLLKYACALERMVIDPAYIFHIGPFPMHYGKRVSWNEGERQKVCERLQGYSKSAVVIIR